MTPKARTTKTRITKQTVLIQPWENAVHYQTMLNFRFKGMPVGAYLLKRTPKSPFTVVFGFKSSGIHSFLSDDKLTRLFDVLESGLKDLPLGEKITFHLGAYQSDEQRQKHLSGLIESAPIEELKFLLWGEKAKTAELSRRGLREPKSLYIFVTYQLQEGTRNQDWLDRLSHQLEKCWETFGVSSRHSPKRNLVQFLRRAWSDGYVHWKQILENKLELFIEPLNSQELWNYVWERLNVTPAIEVPQEIILNRIGVEEKIRSSRHGATLLLAQEEPVCARAWVKAKDKYIGVLTFWDKPGGWKNKRSQLHYLWDLVAKELVTDTEIFTQLLPAKAQRTAHTLRQVTKQSNAKAKGREVKNDVDVASRFKARVGEQAQERLLMGETPFYVATVILVKRKNLEELDEACRYIENCFRRPAWVVRERHVAWKFWLQTLPIIDENLLGSPLIGRRQMYLSGEVLGLVPLVKTQSRDTEGLELIGEDGGTPLFIDLFNPAKHRHLGVFGTTRSGKSVLVGGILTQALVRSIPVVAIDYPKPDGSSTFTTYTEFMEEEGAYFDVGKEAVNLFDRPDLSRLPLDKQQERFEDYKDFLVSCLLIMVVGESEEILLNQTVRTILYRTMNHFFQDDGILNRYHQAEKQGIMSDQWQQMPTLKDFLAYFYRLKQEGAFDALSPDPSQSSKSIFGTSLVDKALEQIGLRLQYWTESRIGKAISSPSSVRRNAAIMVLALRQISENEDAAVLSLVAYASALGRAMSHPLSIFFIDESPILFKFPSVVKLVASIISNGAKSGVRVVLSAQDPDSIFNSSAGQQIFQNINTKIIGLIQQTAIASFIEILGYEQELIERCANFGLRQSGIYKQFLFDDAGTITFARYYAPKVQLALVANNPDEQRVREQFLQTYGDKYEAISAFSNALIKAISQKKPLEIIAKGDLANAKNKSLLSSS